MTTSFAGEMGNVREAGKWNTTSKEDRSYLLTSVASQIYHEQIKRSSELKKKQTDNTPKGSCIALSLSYWKQTNNFRSQLLISSFVSEEVSDRWTRFYLVTSAFEEAVRPREAVLLSQYKVRATTIPHDFEFVADAVTIYSVWMQPWEALRYGLMQVTRW